MSFTQTQISEMPFFERWYRAGMKLGWWSVDGYTWEDIPSLIIRWILFPILERPVNTEPRTLYCVVEEGEEERSTTLLVAAALVDAGLSEITETENDALGRCLAEWSGL